MSNTDMREEIAGEIAGIQVGTGYESTTIGITAALEAADAILTRYTVTEKGREITVNIEPPRCLACGQPDHYCPTGGRLLR